jgi:hypothetical protein
MSSSKQRRRVLFVGSIKASVLLYSLNLIEY